MLNPHQSLILFVLEQAAAQPVVKRIEIIRSLAEICGDADQMKKLKRMARELERTEKRYQEFRFRFSQGTTPRRKK